MTAEMLCQRLFPDADTSARRGHPPPQSSQTVCPTSPSPRHSVGMGRGCPALACAPLCARSPSCPLRAGHAVISASHLVLFYLLVVVINLPETPYVVPLNVLRTTLAFCIWLKMAAPRSAADANEDSGFNSERRMTCPALMVRDQIWIVELQVQGITDMCSLPNFNKYHTKSQQTDNGDFLGLAPHRQNEENDCRERKMEHWNDAESESSKDPSVQQPGPQASPKDLETSLAVAEAPANDVNVVQQELLTEHARIISPNRQNSTDIQIESITASFKNSQKNTKQGKKIITPMKKSPFTQSHQGNSEPKPKELQNLGQIQTKLEESDGEATAIKDDLRKYLGFRPFIPRVEEQVYMCQEPKDAARNALWEEERRLATFSMHQAVPRSGVWVTQLAAAGFFCPDTSSSVLRCAFCSLEVDINEFRHRPPLEVHRGHSPSCPLLTGKSLNTSLADQGQRTGLQFTQALFGSGASVLHPALDHSSHLEKGTPDSHNRGQKEIQGAATQFNGPPSSQLMSVTQSPVPSSQSHSHNNLASATTSVSSPRRGEDHRHHSGSSRQSSFATHANGLPSAASPPFPPTLTLPPSAGTERRGGSQDHLPPAQRTGHTGSSQTPNQTPSEERTHAGGSQSCQPALAQNTSNVSTEGNRERAPTFQTARLDDERQRERSEPSAGPGTDRTAAAAAAGQEAPSSQSSSTNESVRQVVTYAQLGIYTQEPKRPDFAIASTRVNTYTNWPHSETHSPEDLAEAGFYFVGVDDLVRCFYCKGGLKSWSTSLRPWVEHARFYPRCPFVGQVKGQEFIEVVQQLNQKQEDISDAKVEEELKKRQAASEQGATLAAETSEGETEMEQNLLGAVGGAMDGATGGADDEATVHQIALAAAEGNITKTDETHLEKVYEKLEDENVKIKNERMCKICQVEEVGILFLPCGHLVSCSQCAPALRTCAVCRQRVKGRVRVLDDKLQDTPDDADHGKSELS
ncbi:hypothetical protein ACOMHN_040163 [Nucella lapillus]